MIDIRDQDIPQSKENTIPSYCYGETNSGKKRPHNEDMLRVSSPIFLVCDGVGGVNGGENASLSAISQLNFITPTVSGIQEAIYSTNQTILKQGHHHGATTIVGAVEYSPNNYFTFNIGDSPCYLINTDTQQIREISIRDEKTDPYDGRSRLTQCLGDSNAGKNPEPHIFNVPLSPNQALLLCTDGLSDYIDRGQISSKQVVDFIKKYSSKQAVKSLIALANHTGGKDNITALLIKYR